MIHIYRERYTLKYNNIIIIGANAARSDNTYSGTEESEREGWR